MKRVTQILLIVITAGLIIYDIVAIIVGGYESTISNVIKGVAKVSFIPLGWGVLAGHLFTPRKTGAESWKIWIMGIICAIIGTVGTIVNLIGHSSILSSAPTMVIFGAIVGTVLWYQREG